MTEPIDLMGGVVLPVVGKNNAKEAARALSRYGPEEVFIIHVVEKTGGIDSAPAQQREQAAEQAFDAAREELDDTAVHTELRYGESVPKEVFNAADDFKADSIAFAPRESGRIVRALTGNIAQKLITKSKYPVIALPDIDIE